jgi:Leucine-rich repeat (LRR) protein
MAFLKKFRDHHKENKPKKKTESSLAELSDKSKTSLIIQQKDLNNSENLAHFAALVKQHKNTIETLVLRECSLTSIPICVRKLSKLRRVNLDYNHLNSFDATLLASDSIEEVSLSHNSLSEFPPKHCACVASLTKLNLSYNSISLWSKFFFSFNKLEHLNLSHNSLQTLPPDFTQLKTLKTLVLSYNNLTTLPCALFSLTLRQLHLDHNQITSLVNEANGNERPIQSPESSLYNNLTYLDIAGNFLNNDTVTSVSRFTRLTFLNLAQNHLISFPDQLFFLTELRTLYLHENVIASVPINFASLSKLNTLTLYGNDISEVKLLNTSALVHWMSFEAPVLIDNEAFHLEEENCSRASSPNQTDNKVIRKERRRSGPPTFTSQPHDDDSESVFSTSMQNLGLIDETNEIQTNLSSSVDANEVHDFGGRLSISIQNNLPQNSHCSEEQRHDYSHSEQKTSQQTPPKKTGQKKRRREHQISTTEVFSDFEAVKLASKVRS